VRIGNFCDDNDEADLEDDDDRGPNDTKPRPAGLRLVVITR